MGFLQFKDFPKGDMCRIPAPVPAKTAVIWMLGNLNFCVNLMMTHNEEDNVDSYTKGPVEDGDEQTKDGGKQEQSHGVAVLLSWVVEGVLSSMSVDLLGGETE
jgi:hypothetical protein